MARPTILTSALLLFSLLSPVLSAPHDILPRDVVQTDDELHAKLHADGDKYQHVDLVKRQATGDNTTVSEPVDSPTPSPSSVVEETTVTSSVPIETVTSTAESSVIMPSVTETPEPSSSAPTTEIEEPSSTSEEPEPSSTEPEPSEPTSSAEPTVTDEPSSSITEAPSSTEEPESSSSESSSTTSEEDESSSSITETESPTTTKPTLTTLPPTTSKKTRTVVGEAGEPSTQTDLVVVTPTEEAVVPQETDTQVPTATAEGDSQLADDENVAPNLKPILTSIFGGAVAVFAGAMLI